MQINSFRAAALAWVKTGVYNHQEEGWEMKRITKDGRKRILKAVDAAWTWSTIAEAADLYNLNQRDYEIMTDCLIEADDKPWLPFGECLNEVLNW